jgi:phenylpropionate dioxygenase-like ring-hydroxylating dioxygenase large terminal subunit
MIEDPVLINDWHVVARSSDLGPGTVRSARLLEQDLVVWRDGREIHIWRDICIHRGAKLSKGTVRRGCLVCPYHGWTYDPEGACVTMPAHPGVKPPDRARAQVCQATERYGLVWACLGSPSGDVPPFPEWDDSSFRKVACGPYPLNAYAPRVVENFLDVGHFPFVHAGYLGDASRPEIADYEAEITAEGVIARDIRVWQPDPDGSGQPAEVSYTYRALRPLTAMFYKEQGPQRFCMIDSVSPVEMGRSIAWVILAINYAPEVPDEKLREFQDIVTAQDIPVVESQRPELLPLDLQMELHLRSDRTAIAYRRWLRQLGLKFGTA